MTGRCLLSYIIAIFLVTFSNYSNCQPRSQYEVPEPKIEVFPKGFRVSIPDQEGISLFAFHGNINIPMNSLAAGQYSQDILKQKDGEWVFEDTRATLNVGDVIHYWLYVLRFNLGYRYDDGKFVVKQITPSKGYEIELERPSHKETSKGNWFFESLNKPAAHASHKNQVFLPIPLPSPSRSTFTSAPTESTTFKSGASAESTPLKSTASGGSTTIKSTALGESTTESRSVSACCQLFSNISSQLVTLSEQFDKLTEENKILTVIAQKDDHYSRTLRLFGKYSAEYYPTPKKFAQNLIREKLKLSDVKVLEAKTVPDNGISFKVETLQDKVKVILAARKELVGSNYELAW